MCVEHRYSCRPLEYYWQTGVKSRLDAVTSRNPTALETSRANGCVWYYRREFPPPPDCNTPFLTPGISFLQLGVHSPSRIKLLFPYKMGIGYSREFPGCSKVLSSTDGKSWFKEGISKCSAITAIEKWTWSRSVKLTRKQQVKVFSYRQYLITRWITYNNHKFHIIWIWQTNWLQNNSRWNEKYT